MLYLGTQVLILLDLSYVSRFCAPPKRAVSTTRLCAPPETLAFDIHPPAHQLPM